MKAVKPDADALARACAAAMYERDRAARAMGIAIDEARSGYARLSMTIGETMLNGHDIAHGGVTFALADTAFAYACNSRNVPNVALQCSVSYVAPVRLGDRLTAEATEQSASGRTGVYDVTVTRAGDDAVVAMFRGVCYRVKGTVLEGAAP